MVRAPRGRLCWSESSYQLISSGNAFVCCVLQFHFIKAQYKLGSMYSICDMLSKITSAHLSTCKKKTLKPLQWGQYTKVNVKILRHAC